MTISLFPDTPDLLLRLLVASTLGALIGFERDVHGRNAGLRTHLLVSLGAALFAIMSEYYAAGIVNAGGRADPGRIAAQVVTGIGFLGAGAIIKSGLTIRGLTTAACLWLAAAIGLAAGAACYLTAGAAALIGLFALIVLKSVEKVYPSDFYRNLTVVTGNDVDPSRIAEAVRGPKVSILLSEFEQDFQAGVTRTRFSIRLTQGRSGDEPSRKIIERIRAAGIPIKSIKWGRLQ